MGNSIAATMKTNMENNSKIMTDNQKQLMMRQRQMQLATQFAMGKERFQWFQGFYFIVCPLMLIGGIKEKVLQIYPYSIKKKPQMIIPILPLSFLYGYQYDMYYWNKMYRIRQEAERLLLEEPELFFLPKGNGIYNEEEYRAALNIPNNIKHTK